MANTQSCILRKVIWFEKREKFNIDFFDLLQPQRTVNQHSRYKTGTFFSEKCQREIQYESGLELAFYKQLERMNQVKFYWEQPIRIPYWRGKRKDTYTPDTAIYLQSKEVVLVEIKDLPTMLDYRVQTKTEALLDFCNKKGFGLLITDGKDTIEKIYKTKSNCKLENALIKTTKNNTIRKKECKELMADYNATQNELLKAILKHNLRFKTFPLKIQSDNRNIIFPQVFFHKRKYEEIIAEHFSKIFSRIKEYNQHTKHH